jgi:hypothetical protein
MCFRRKGWPKVIPVRKQFVIGAIALAALSTGVAAACGTRAEDHTYSVSALTRKIIINRQDRITFAPAPAAARPALTAQQAWAKYTTVNTSYHGSAMPAKVTAFLGLFTLPTGPNGTGPYTAHNELAYGYSWHRCPQSTNPGTKKLPPNPCREWNFLNANTGRQIVETWQF